MLGQEAWLQINLRVWPIMERIFERKHLTSLLEYLDLESEKVRRQCPRNPQVIFTGRLSKSQGESRKILSSYAHFCNYMIDFRGNKWEIPMGSLIGEKSCKRLPLIEQIKYDLLHSYWTSKRVRIGINHWYDYYFWRITPKCACLPVIAILSMLAKVIF